MWTTQTHFSINTSQKRWDLINPAICEFLSKKIYWDSSTILLSWILVLSVSGQTTIFTVLSASRSNEHAPRRLTTPAGNRTRVVQGAGNHHPLWMSQNFWPKAERSPKFQTKSSQLKSIKERLRMKYHSRKLFHHPESFKIWIINSLYGSCCGCHKSCSLDCIPALSTFVWVVSVKLLLLLTNGPKPKPLKG